MTNTNYIKELILIKYAVEEMLKDKYLEDDDREAYRRIADKITIDLSCIDQEVRRAIEEAREGRA